jgi:hypothetical protein
VIKSLATPWALVAVLAFATPAPAKQAVLVPPGDSAASQYVEVVPTAGGPGVTHTGGPPSPVLNSSQTSQLDSHGAAGRALVALVNGTSPSSSHPATAAKAQPQAPAGSGPGGQVAAFSTVKPQSAAASVAAAAIGRGGGGLGALLPILIGLAVLAVVIGAIRRLRAQS